MHNAMVIIALDTKVEMIGQIEEEEQSSRDNEIPNSSP